MDAIIVLLVGAQRASLQALAKSLDSQTGLTSAGVLTNTAEIATSIRKHHATVLLIEGGLLANDPACTPVVDAITADPEVRVIIMGGSQDVATWALCEGACGFVPDDAHLEDVVSAIRDSVGDGVALMPAMQLVLLKRFQEVGPGWTRGGQAASGLLTGREMEIVRLIADGGTNSSVAIRCGISESTVKNHLANIFRKLGACSRSQMVAEAFRHGLLDRGE